MPDTGLRVDSNTSAIVSYSTAAYNGGNGFAGFASPSLLFDHLTAHHNSWDTTKTDTAGINLTDTSTGYWPGTPKTATNIIVQHSESYDNGVAVCCSHGLGIWADTVGDGFIVRYNYVHDNNGVGIYAEKDSSVIVHHNIVVSNRGVSGDVLGGIVLYMDCASTGCSMRNSLVANNVVYGNYGHGIRLLAQSITNDCGNNRVVNNISTGNNGDQLDAEYGCENVTYGSGNVYAYNSLGVAGWDSIGGDAVALTVPTPRGSLQEAIVLRSAAHILSKAILYSRMSRAEISPYKTRVRRSRRELPLARPIRLASTHAPASMDNVGPRPRFGHRGRSLRIPHKGRPCSPHRADGYSKLRTLRTEF